MKNFEKYIDELIATGGDICDFVTSHKITDCGHFHCGECRGRLFRWLNKEYEPQIDWSKVPVDTPIMVNIFAREVRRYFSHIDCYGIAYFDDGKTSWSNDECVYWATECDVRLARPEDIEKYSI